MIHQRTVRAARGVLPILLLPALLGSSVRAGEGEWTNIGTDEGITIFRKEIPGDPVFAYKAEGTLNASVGKLVTIARDAKRMHEWVNRLRTARVLREVGPDHRIMYLKVDAPWPVSDRDFVVELKIEADRAKKSAILTMHSVEDALAPENDCCVRGEMHNNRIELRSAEGNKAAVSAQAHVDPRGSIPKWIVNKIQRSFPRKTIAGLLRQVGKPDIRDAFEASP